MAMNPRKLVPTQEPGVLDFAPGAAAAYSLRNLSYTYAGPVVTVRRSTDDAEADFTANEVSDGTLAAWCSGGDGFVKTWHDQSGNERDATQATAGSQPQIVDSGSLVTEGGKAAVQFDGSDDYLENGPMAVAFSGEDVPMSTFLAFNATDLSLRMPIGFGRSTTDIPLIRPWYIDTDGSFRVFNRDDANVSTSHDFGVVGSGLQHVTTVSTGSLISVWQSGAPILSDANINIGEMTLDRFAVGALPRTSISGAWQGTISEAIIYPTDQTALRTRIEGNLAWYY